ncbi:Receptor-like cytosolic serine/threonine-protein kinase RBK2 [Capsicum baccatum]|uniref:Receptor-like cytosolic serine/threonine-protein kinase RBK2 n=1 Tax=Capsicum baccatum TaxID=33114 RepID=A0A2G2VYG5_CAPBA|nr:Receptor-like cytosolic serine/threonine-protein kinase RBK2 [Capsicum baccatum]
MEVVLTEAKAAQAIPKLGKWKGAFGDRNPQLEFLSINFILFLCFPDRYRHFLIQSLSFFFISAAYVGPQDERTGDFLSEFGIMAHVSHPNIAKLIGYAVEGELYLVLELSPHGILANMLRS